MRPDLADLHDELRAVAADLLAAAGTGSAVDWAVLARAGWCGLEVPEALDGAGATFAEVAVVLQEMGRAATRSPFLGGVVLGVGALASVEPGPGRDALLRDAASGTVVVALALSGDEEVGGDDAVPFRIERSAGRARVQGEATFVSDAAEAGRLLLPALDPDHGLVLVEVAAGTPGLHVTPQPVVDATRRLGVVRAVDVAPEGAVGWRFTGEPEAATRRLRDRAAVALACDSLGLSEAMLDATVAYAGVREQFGRPIGSFQAVKHACADMLVQIALARELVAAAVEQLASAGVGSPAVGDEVTAAASMAKAWTCGTAVDIAGAAMQLHGGIGYTWESGIHVYLKRAALNRSLFGSPAAHRRRLAARHT